MGVAISDGSALIAQPWKVWDQSTAAGHVFGLGPDSLTDLMERFRVPALVVGLPFTSGSGEDEACARIRRFVARLHTDRVIQCPVFLWDEAGTSQESRAVLRDVHDVTTRSAQKRRGADKMAACLILQRFLDHFNRVRRTAALDAPHPPSAPPPPPHPSSRASPSAAAASSAAAAAAAAVAAATAQRTARSLPAAAQHMALTLHLQMAQRARAAGAVAAALPAASSQRDWRTLLPRNDPYCILPRSASARA